MSYFDQVKYVSNSDLTRLQKMLRVDTRPPPTAAWAFGTLLDASLTEAHKVNHGAGVLVDETKGTLFFEEEEMEKARLMAEAAHGDSTVRFFLDGETKLQHEVYKELFMVEYEGQQVWLPVRCKFDALKAALAAAADFKSTQCTTLAGFVESIEHFNYDRQAAWYMDLKGLKYFWIIGISKRRDKITKRYPVFKFVIEAGDATYLRGRAKYSFLAHRYYYLIHTLDLS